MEVLEHTPKPTRRGPIVALAVIAVLILLVLGAVTVDNGQRERESLAVQTAYAEAVATIETAQARVRGTVAYASPLLQVGPADVRAALEELVLEGVEAGRTEFARARQVLNDTPVWPWHNEVLEQRAALVADLDDRARSLAEATGQGLFVP
jgi:hypothetical protein